MLGLRLQILIVSMFLFPLSLYAGSSRQESFQSGGKTVSYEVFGEDADRPLLILLHGSGGPYVAYQRQIAEFFAARNYTVLYLHYFDATSNPMPTDENYSAWVRAVADLVRECQQTPRRAGRKIAMIGFSLGASVALGAGSQLVPVQAIAEWYGSLPDKFFYQLKGMPPLLILHGVQDSNIPILNAKQLVRLCEMGRFTCENHLYPNQNHGFFGADFEDAEKRTLNFFARELK